MPTKKSNITLYTDQTPNGVKIPMTLELLGLEYKTVTVDITTNEQKKPWFTEINPNGRIPALTDTIDVDGKEKEIRLFEGGSILQYLVDQYDTEHKMSYPHGSPEYYETNNWIWFQGGGLGPMQGQSNHFYRYAPEKIQYGIDRYLNESRRLYRVLDTHLKEAGTKFIVGDKVTIADIACVGWVHWAGWAGIDIEEFQNVKSWEVRMFKIDAIAKGNDIPHPSKIKNLLNDPEGMSNYAAESREWIMKGMKDDKDKSKE